MQYPVFSCRVVASSYLFVFFVFFVISNCFTCEESSTTDKRRVGRLRKIGSPFNIFIINSRLLIRSHHHLSLGGTTWHGPGLCVWIHTLVFFLSLFSRCMRICIRHGAGSMEELIIFVFYPTLNILITNLIT